MRKTIQRNHDFLAITVVEAKQWCRIDEDADDALLEGLIRAATDAAEAFTNRAIVPATIEFSYKSGDGCFAIPTAPVVAAGKVELETSRGARTELPAESAYWLRVSDSGAVLTLTGHSRGKQTLVATCSVGYAGAASVPRGIKLAISTHVGSAYEGREGQDTAKDTFENLLRPFVVSAI
ncbi:MULTISPECIES: head-tail connector protein [unclassified Sphingobium]|uniref:head-tail connector protein n=1 Tax=unclassified Sphingobium TaxID=2611147 RepID=UPI002224BFE8|nr:MULTISPECIES: head-tail connector protein [unclassified Sphingobium]MCW2412930.1 putative phiE125 gp8 family phage protein [Sphingobium sp. B8D3D]MCW2414772.1 putative phiE125 gp8 family phage protein [Sphingobium sp. B8D3A]